MWRASGSEVAPLHACLLVCAAVFAQLSLSELPDLACLVVWLSVRVQCLLCCVLGLCRVVLCIRQHCRHSGTLCCEVVVLWCGTVVFNGIVLCLVGLCVASTVNTAQASVARLAVLRCGLLLG